MNDIFNKTFWIHQWTGDVHDDTYAVHKGFSSADYWDRAAASYNQDQTEIKNRRAQQTIHWFKENDLFFDGMTVLDIGCGPGLMSIALAQHGAKVTALDFSANMLKRLEQEMPLDLKKRITLVQEDWHGVDISDKGWENKFDLVLAFMSPGVATPEAFFKMMACSRKGCAIRGWAAKNPHPILIDIWKKIMGTPLEDKPQSFLYKINLLFSMGIFPQIRFDTIEWEQNISIQEELKTQTAFFERVSQQSRRRIEPVIRSYLENIAQKGRILKKHSGLTGTAVWKKINS